MAIQLFKPTLLTFCSISLLLSSDTSEDRALSAIRPEAIRAHMRFLADDLLEGRGTGTRGYELAAKYIAAELEALGLEPCGINGTYFQPIRFRSVLGIPEKTTLEITRAGTQESLVYGQDFIATGDSQKTVSSLTAPLVYVGYGITAPDFGLDDYAGIDASGKIVVYLAGAPAKLPATVKTHLSTILNKRITAKAHGAVGMIRAWSAQAEQLMSFRATEKQYRRPVMSWLAPDGTPSDQRDTVRVIAFLSEAGSQKLFTGSPSSLADLQKAIVDGTSKPVALPVSIASSTTSRHSETSSSNVCAVLRGSDAELRNEFVVYSSHADHLGIGEPVQGDSIYNGALDNASGTAGLLEIARAFTTLTERPKRSVIFLAVTAEEQGLLGSDYFAINPTVPRRQIVANINIDGMNLAFDFRDAIVLGAEHSSLGKVAERAAARMNLQLSPDPAPAQNMFARSDQYSFVRHGVPAIYPLGGMKPVDPKVNVMKLGMQLQARYHLPNDDMSFPFNFDAGAKNAKFDFLLGYFIAQEEARPRWNEGDFFEKLSQHERAVLIP